MEELLSHSNFGWIATKGTDIFLDPPQGLSLCEETVRLFPSYRHLGVGCQTLTVMEPEVTNASGLDLLPPQKAERWYAVLVTIHTPPSLENSPETLIQQQV